MEILLQGIYYGALVAASIAVIFIFLKLTHWELREIWKTIGEIRTIRAETRELRAARKLREQQTDGDSNG